MRRYALIGSALLAVVFVPPVRAQVPPQPPPVPADAVAAAARTLTELYDAIARGDDRTVAGSVLAPVPLSRDDSLLYARRLIVGSQLDWLLNQRFGAEPARQVVGRARLEWVPHHDPATLKWESIPVTRQSAAVGALETLMGKPADQRGQPVFVSRTEHGWALNRVQYGNPSVLIMDLEDAPWRNAVVARALDDLRAGRLNGPDDVTAALVLHAPAKGATTARADRTTPEGVIPALADAIERGDEATVADSFRFAREDRAGAAEREQLAARFVADRKLAKALTAKFGPEQGARLEKQLSLGTNWVETYRPVTGWIVDGDVARAALNRAGYDVTKRMVRAGGVWRIELPPKPAGAWRPADQQAIEQWRAQRPQRENDVLAHLDDYPTPGSVIEALDVSSNRARQARGGGADRPDPDEQLREARQRAATQPAANPQQAFEQQMGITFLQIGAAMSKGDAKAAAACYCADGDPDGAYVLARERRALAATRLMDAAGREIGGDAAAPLNDLHDLADDLYGLAMVTWTVHGDQATGAMPEGFGGASGEVWLPALRKVGGSWKIDVTGETDGDAKAAAKRADDETRKLDELTAQVRRLKFKTPDEFKAALTATGVKGPNRPM